MGRSAEAYAAALAQQQQREQQEQKEQQERKEKPEKQEQRQHGPATFAELGLHPPLAAALRAAFPHVQTPTAGQARFIPAVLAGQDVLLRDGTGTGKSFGLILALLSKPRRNGASAGSLLPAQSLSHGCAPTSLVVVPHRDLAHQMMDWIARLVSAAPGHARAPPLAAVAQVLVRDGGTHLGAGLHALRTSPPHVLIGTPQALLDVHGAGAGGVLGGVRCVVVDEVDYLVETLPRKEAGRSFGREAERRRARLRAHPGVTRELLGVLFGESGARGRIGVGGRQVVLASATLRSHLTRYLFEESGWLDKGNLLKVRGTGGAARPGVLHSVLVVSDDGIANIAGAVRLRSEDGQAIPPLSSESWLHGDTGHNATALEAIAIAIALDVPSLALLVLPASAGVQRAVHELRELGVNAHGLDLGTSAGGGGSADPTLLVATDATTRGLDLAGLTHVFMLGVPGGAAGQRVDGYVHVAGRVRGGGKVVAVVMRGEEWKMDRVLGSIGVQAVQFGQFD